MKQCICIYTYRISSKYNWTVSPVVGNFNICTYKCIFGLTMLILVARTTRRYCTPPKKGSFYKVETTPGAGFRRLPFLSKNVVYQLDQQKKPKRRFVFPFRFHYKHLYGVTGREVGMKASWRRATEFHVGTTMLRNHPKNTCTIGGLWRSKVGGKEL